MFLVYRLLLAHFIADFPLQSAEIIKWKMRSLWGLLFHGGIFLALACVFTLTYLKDPWVWGIILLLFVAHIGLNYGKRQYIKKSGRDSLWVFLVEQAAHVGLIFLIPLIYEVKIPKYLWGSFFSPVYNSNLIINSLTLVVIAVFGGSLILHYIKKTFVDENITFKHDWDGMLERASITCLFLAPLYFLLLIPLVIAIRVVYYLLSYGHLGPWPDIIKREEPPLAYQKIKVKGKVVIDLVGSPALSILIGLALRGL